MFTSPLSFHAATERSFIISFTSKSLHTREPISTFVFFAICFFVFDKRSNNMRAQYVGHIILVLNFSNHSLRGVHETTPQSELLARTGGKTSVGFDADRPVHHAREANFEGDIHLSPKHTAIYLAKTKRPSWTPISRSGEFFFFYTNFCSFGNGVGGFFDTLFICC